MMVLRVVPFWNSALAGSFLDELKNRYLPSGETKAELALSSGVLISGPNLISLLQPPAGVLKLI
jgi:hypothetical protein